MHTYNIHTNIQKDVTKENSNNLISSALKKYLSGIQELAMFILVTETTFVPKYYLYSKICSIPEYLPKVPLRSLFEMNHAISCYI